MVERTVVLPVDRHSPYVEHHYSAAIHPGDLLFVPGQVGSRKDGVPKPDSQQRVRLAFDNLHATLTAAGRTFDDVIDVTSFHTDPESQSEDIMMMRSEIFSAPSYLNRMAVGVTWLAGFGFEIKMIARILEQ